MIVNDKNGISSYEVPRALGITQKSAWFMMHRIRLAMQRGGFMKLPSDVEADETHIGSKARFMHPHKRAAKITGTDGMGKTAVMGLLERHGPDGHSRVYVKPVPNIRRKTLAPEVRANGEPGSALYTDSLASYGLPISLQCTARHLGAASLDPVYRSLLASRRGEDTDAQ